MYWLSHKSSRVWLLTAPLHFAIEKLNNQSTFKTFGRCLYHTKAYFYNTKTTNCVPGTQTNSVCCKGRYQEDIVEPVRGEILSLCVCDIVVVLSGYKREKTKCSFGYSVGFFPTSIKEITQAVIQVLYKKRSELCDNMSDKPEGPILSTGEKVAIVSYNADRIMEKSGVDTAGVCHDSLRDPEQELSDVSIGVPPILSSGQEQLTSAKVGAAKEMSVRWMFDVGFWRPSEGEWVSALSSVQQEEYARICCFAFRRDARASLAGRLLARLFVSRALSIPWGAVRLQRDDRGKPTVREGLTDAKVSLSISHAGRWAVLAGEAGYGSSVADTVGVDVVEEKHRDAAHLLRLMKRNLSTVEQVSIEKASRDGPAVFFRLWALKESYLKATGEGIGGGPELSDLSFSFCGTRLPDAPGSVEVGTTLEVKGRPLPRGWHFEESRIDASHIVAVAVSRSEGSSCKMKSPPPVFKEIPWDEFRTALEPVTHHEPPLYLDYFNKPESPAYLQNTSKR